MIVHVQPQCGPGYQIDVERDDTVENLKIQITEKTGYPPEKQKLSYGAKPLMDSYPLSHYGIVNGVTVSLEFRLGGPPCNVNWKPFIVATQPKSLETDVELMPQIKVNLQKHMGKRINTMLIVNRGEKRFQESWDNYFDATGAFWTDYTFYQRLVVLELRDEFAELGFNMLDHIDKVRYNWQGINNTYYGGDSRSWQRYTKHLPVKGQVKITGLSEISFILAESLKPNTWYAVTLLHSNHNYADAIYDDHLIPFKTVEEEVPDLLATPASLECCVCMTKQVSLVYLPCGHVCCCTTCDANISQCPKCRSPIHNKHKVFF